VTGPVLVTGGAGFIGLATCAALARAGHEPLVFDRHALRAPYVTMAVAGRGTFADRGRYETVLGDVRDATAVTEAAARASAVIHLAGVLGTAETITNPRPAADINIGGAVNVLEAAAQYRLPLVNIAVGNWTEVNTYSITKTAAERLVTMYARHRGLNACSVRAFNAYGPGQPLVWPYGPSRVRKIIPSFACRGLSGDPIEVYGDGTQVMDMIYVTDVAGCLLAALDGLQAGQGAGEVYQAGTGRATTVTDIANAVATTIAVQSGQDPPPVEYLPMRPGETPAAVVLADPARVKDLADPASFVTLEDGLSRAVGWYRLQLSRATARL
jgi:UDP-glucose 4-epimerase